MSAVRVDILGELEVRTEDDTPVAVPGSRLRALVALLALAGGRPVPSERIVEELWDEDERPAGAVNALQVLVSRLRRTLPPGLVESRPRAYRLALEPESVDAVRFEGLVTRGRALAGTDDAAAADALRAALALWRGPALADLDDAGFVRAQRDRLEELRLAAVEDRVGADLALGGGADLVPELEALVAAHPLRERPRAQLVRALSAAGRRADALAAYEDARRRLAHELGVDPGPELARAQMAVLRGEAAPRPARGPAGTAPRPRTNVRAQLTHFVGREREVAEVERLLEEARLVTLVGPGGAGKTRLASECGARLVDALPDGVWMVELASVTDPADVPRALVSVLGLRADGLIAQAANTPGPRERLTRALRDKRLLLVIDNCEQVVDAAAALVDHLLAHCPQLRVLATSREPLGITGERLIHVDPLPVPEAVTPAELALRSPVVRLFSERATAARPSFRVTPGNVAVVLDICRALDGLPLAIELAATRLRSMSPEQVRARLDDRFALLTAGSRTALPRQQTLHAVVDWSWELLSADERELAVRFCVFRSGAFLDAVERVTAGATGSEDGPLRREEVLGLLSGLVDKSFLTVTESDGESRYHMLQTVRAFALAKLDAGGGGEHPRRRHARYFLDLAERAEPRLRRHDQLTWLRRLTLEHDEFTAALAWATEHGESAIAARLVAALGWYWFLRGFRQEAAQWAERALSLDQKPVPPAARALALVTALPRLVGEGSDPEGYRARIAEVRALLDGMERDGEPFSHPALGLFEPIANMLSGDGFLLESIRRRSRDADPWVRGLAHLHRGQIETTLGETRRGAADYDLAAELFRGIGERWGTAQVLVAGAEAQSSRGERRAAIGALEEALRLIDELGDREDQPLLRVRLATERAYDGDLARAQDELRAALELADELGARDQRVPALQAMGDVARWAGATDRARGWLERARGEFEATGQGIDQVHALLLASLGSVELADGHPDTARERFVEAVGQLPPTPEPGIVARLLELLADMEAAGGRPLRAARFLGAADALRGTPHDAASGPDSARVAAAVRAALPREERLAAYRRGTGTGHRAAVALLRAETTGRPAP
ncbi:BTAD domain-containing putative transcriptional regulator [Streptomyces sp. NPDC048606]|uniref:BTAD domain-containing putative transcriptional regulator n=1 Tax=Streptomyces sp. NPDC048606 TaxID=3154726 RepID=UPI003425147C